MREEGWRSFEKERTAAPRPMYSLHGVITADRYDSSPPPITMSAESAHRPPAAGSARKMMNYSASGQQADVHSEAEVRHKKVELLQVSLSSPFSQPLTLSHPAL